MLKMSHSGCPGLKMWVATRNRKKIK